MSRLIFEHELPRQVHACCFDIFKAFDHVNLDMVNSLIENRCKDIKVLIEWKNELEDLKRMNLDISGQVIKRTKGILQGSELSPFIFNFITTCILEDIDSKSISSQILVYADNWIVVNNDKVTLTQDIVKIIESINKYGFIVQKNDLKFFQFKKRCTSNKCENIFKNATNKEKILGINFIFNNNYMEIDKESMKFSININYSTDPHTAILLIKKFYNPKFRYYADMLRIWDYGEYETYLNWYKKEIRRVFNRITVTLLVPNELIDNIVNEGIMDRRTNYYWFYAADFKENIPNDNRMIKEKLKRWKNLAYWLKNEDKYLGIHTIFNFIMQSNTDDPYNYVKSYIDKKNLHRTYINLDLAYNAIISNKDMISVMEYSQEIINENLAICFYDPLKNKINNYYC